MGLQGRGGWPCLPPPPGPSSRAPRRPCVGLLHTLVWSVWCNLSVVSPFSPSCPRSGGRAYVCVHSHARVRVRVSCERTQARARVWTPAATVQVHVCAHVMHACGVCMCLCVCCGSTHVRVHLCTLVCVCVGGEGSCLERGSLERGGFVSPAGSCCLFRDRGLSTPVPHGRPPAFQDTCEGLASAGHVHACPRTRAHTRAQARTHAHTCVWCKEPTWLLPWSLRK